MSECGVDETTQVVAYDNEGGIFASRLWWMLRWLGHERVAVLDGGLAGWKRAKRELDEMRCRVVAPRKFNAATAGHDRRRRAVADGLARPAPMILDARSPERFRGENETLDPVGGHIPGRDESLLFRQPRRCRLLLQARCGTARRIRRDAGRPSGVDEVVQQCGSGVTACHNLLAMELAGLSGSKLYPGSWSEWCADPSRPVASLMMPASPFRFSMARYAYHKSPRRRAPERPGDIAHQRRGMPGALSAGR
jgi:thiosulfate/3-mercaptopyruvate sulfurtransferase